MSYVVNEKFARYRQFKFIDAKTVADFSRKHLYSSSLSIYEEMFLLLLDMQLKVKGFAKIAQGSTSQCTIDIKIILKYAIDTLSSSIILVHNHPSGNAVPSMQDKILTEDLRKCLRYCGIDFLDHIIVTEKDFYSFSETDLIL